MMGRGRRCIRVVVLLLNLTVAATFFQHCDSRRIMHGLGGPGDSIVKHSKLIKRLKHLDLASLLLQREIMDSSNTSPYVSSPFTLPPYDSLGPIPMPENSPPYCVYPPPTPLPPSTPLPTLTPPVTSLPPPTFYLPPGLPFPSPPPPSPENLPVPSPPTEVVPSPPGEVPGPPEFVPGPPVTFPGPPSGPIIGPPFSFPSPPSGPIIGPPYYTPPSSVPFLPPIVYPPPAVPPPPKLSPMSTLWCVAKPSVPEPILEEAMNYACGSGADCESIEPNGPCYAPNTYLAHASYAFNSYWQKTRLAGGTCSFGGTAILVTVDPSYDGCHFVHS